MIGDSDDIAARMERAEPASWFPPAASPVRDAVHGAAGYCGSLVYGLVQFARRQVRITTAEGGWLDFAAFDFFGRALRRWRNESDTQYRARVKRELFRERGTRAALIAVLTDMTGRAPVVFEPANPSDAGGYGTAGMSAGTGLAYGLAGGYGSLALPYQCFVTAFRPVGVGIGGVNGYGGGLGGYGVGAQELASLDMMGEQVTDETIFDAVARTMPAATIAWTRITA